MKTFLICVSVLVLPSLSLFGMSVSKETGYLSGCKSALLDIYHALNLDANEDWLDQFCKERYEASQRN